MGNDLARRVRDNTSTERADREPGAPSLGKQIQQMQQQFALAMPRGAEAAQLVRDALTCLRTTPKLAECEPASVLGGLMTCAQLGLRPGVPGLGHAWLLPFWDSRLAWVDEKGRERTGGQRAQLVIGYQGYRELAQRTGQIATVIARAVHAEDHFEIDYGIADNLVHKPKLDGPRGEAIGFYAIVKYTSGGYAFWHMSKSEVEEHRDRYAMARKQIWRNGKKTGETEIVGPWRDNFDEMAAKTVFLRLAKWMPKATELASAIEADGSVRVDITPDPDALLHGEHPDVIDSDAEEGPAEISAPESADPAADDDQPAGEPLATDAQLKRLHALLSKCDVADPDERRTIAGQMSGRPLGSMKDLRAVEIQAVNDVLADIAKNAEPVMALDAYLASLDQTEGA